MKNLLPVASLCAVLVALAACETDSPSHSNASSHSATQVIDAPTPTPTPEIPPTPEPTPVSGILPTPTPTPSSSGQLPYGIPVPGKPGFVTSPYAQGSGYVDVRGFPPNTEVKDPYSGKVFLVP